MVYSFPANRRLCDRYTRIRSEEFCAGRDQLPGGASIDLHLPEAPPIDGDPLPDPWRTARSDPNGELVPMGLGTVRTVGSYWLVADYDGDGLY